MTINWDFIGILLIVKAWYLEMYTFIQSFESVAFHLELAILFRNIWITEHAQIFKDLHFQQVMGLVSQNQ